MMLPAAGPSAAQTCGAVLVSAVLLQSVCVAITFLYFTNELKQLRDTYSKSGIACLTSEEMGDFIQNLDLTESEDRVADPCWQVKWHLGKLIKKMMSRSYEENISAVNAEGALMLPTDRQPPRSPSNRIAAHLTGNSNRKNSLSPSPRNSSPRRGNGQKLNNWESSRKGHSFLHNVELRNGELVIPQMGLYYIYAQTYFRFRENENEDSDLLAQIRNPKQLVQYVYKLTNYPEPILLMKSARTSCWSKKAEYGLYSIYQGGVFQLKREDRIFVSVSNGDIVDMDKEASFFGAFMIS
ncbi:tumor necrosis factor ligand superfamily member 10 isoform X2 [Falco biarmicus]|uniref:Tumor necrosis factor ligand superfamily member 10 n=1 Tax=Falco tinnunculus TaxID=100819 RepID=A0A8C4UC32_FALTI|nr:tumor necrosis factor ligand superfamily member 10 isoform X2 [Falco rusticolus]XP_040469347.1 tumor necrosis factor ligand superfamily member 10 isoform X2 [Falco naumanni]XP_055579170.1 tumor necrosis factor ligand superfamily member 10 isoform X2 [Falco cherrug]XP_055672764.1 tumor necrosis factor ligand superfamily member 10 isoform X2 [Falco peregrinus]XP_056213881.1 tumor necrosis factor ligand superfamily member 10 isoform X2 [Falco biarmicus]